MMTEYHAGRMNELKAGGRILLKCGNAEIGRFLVDGKLYAWHNECAHRGGPICQGRIFKRVVEPVGRDGTVRTMDLRLMHEILERIERVVAGVTAAFGATYRLSCEVAAPPAIRRIDSKRHHIRRVNGTSRRIPRAKRFS